MLVVSLDVVVPGAGVVLCGVVDGVVVVVVVVDWVPPGVVVWLPVVVEGVVVVVVWLPVVVEGLVEGLVVVWVPVVVVCVPVDCVVSCANTAVANANVSTSRNAIFFMSLSLPI